MAVICVTFCALSWFAFYGLGWWYAARYIRCRWYGARSARRFNQRLLWWMETALWSGLLFSMLTSIVATPPIPVPLLVAGAFAFIFSGLCVRQVGAYPR